MELLAETPVFVAQVFCFIKLRVVLDTLHIFVRSVLFIWLVLRDPNRAIFAFSIAQVGSTMSFVIGYYGFFIYYIHQSNVDKGATKRATDSNADNTEKNRMSRKGSIEPDDTIPFSSITHMLPGFMNNSVKEPHQSHFNFRAFHLINFLFLFRF